MIIFGYRKGKDLGDLFEKIGISKYFALDFEEKGVNCQLERKHIRAVLRKEGFDIDYIEQNYELLSYYPEIEVFGDYEEDTSLLRVKFYDEMMRVKLPKSLVRDDLLVFYSEFIGM